MRAADLEGELLGPTLGRRVEGLDLSVPMTDATFAALEEVFSRNPVMVFRDQSLGAARGGSGESFASSSLSEG